MTDYEELLEKAKEDGITVDDIKFNSNRIRGLYCDKHIAISCDIDTSTERKEIMAEELGHAYTTTGIILDNTNPENRKQERRARAWAYDHLLGPSGVKEAVSHGCTTECEIAEYTGLSCEFVHSAIEYYTTKELI